MRTTSIWCNMCGNRFTDADKACGFFAERKIGYGSSYDGELFSIDLCCQCLDKLIESCKITPIRLDDDEEPAESICSDRDEYQIGIGF